MKHRVRRPASGLLPALAAVALAITAAPRAQTVNPTVVFVSPVDGDYASGLLPVRIRLEPQADSEVQSVSLVADGKLLCALERPPFECAWDAGPRLAAHSLRASVLLKNGQRVSRTIQTRGAGYAESVEVDVVQVTATVTDGRGQFVSGLTRDRFRVFEDDRPQRITAFIAQDVPLELIVAVDISGSMKNAMPTVKEAVKRFLSALRPEDRVTLVSFNDRVYTLTRPSADPAARLRAVDRLAPWGGTALHDVIVRSIEQLGRETGRRAVVIFTDGEDRDSVVPFEAAERRLEASDVVLYPIGQGRAPKEQNLRRVLEGLAQKSGGRAFFEDLGALDSVFSRIVDELSHQYLLGYERPDAAKDSRWRKLRVEVSGRDLKIRHREGYRVTEK